ncbi:MAG: hypothetical protein JWM34_1034 [Ilumatobacteraceae bacterium]|nr:hypothetical protein [Ilumatobacteraceae bacterium]
MFVVPLVVALMSVSRVTWYPTGDMAQAELHVSGFFAHPPLVGAAGRIGDVFAPYGQGSHPGPAMWFALLPLYLITGRSSFGMELGMTVMQLTFLVATIAVVRRLIGGIGGFLTAVVAAVLVYSMGPAVFIEPWNPWGGVFAFFCFIALCWGIVCGRHRWLAAAAFCGFFAVQCHAGYVPLVGATLAAMVVFLAIRWRRARPDGILRSWWIAVAVTVVMWTPPVIDQLRRNPGNLRILWHHFTSSTEADGTPRAFVGIGAALKAFAGELSLPGPWIRGDFRQPSASPNLIGLVVAVAVVAVTVRLLLVQRSTDGDARRDMLMRLFILLGGLTIVGVFSTARVFGEFYDYVIRWWWLIVAWIFLACALVLIRRLRTEVVVGGALVIALLMSGLATANALGEQNPGERNGRIVGGIDALLRQKLTKSDHYLIRWDDPLSLGGVPFGMLLDLEKHGFHLGVDAGNAAGALPHRVLPEASASSVLWVVLGQANIDRFAARSDAVELGEYDVRTPAEQNRSDTLRQQITDRLTALGQACLVPKLDEQYGLASFYLGTAGVPDDVVRDAGDYYDLGLPVAVFDMPTFAPPVVTATSTC